MAAFIDALRSGRILLMDGAMGTELQKLGLNAGECGEEWNLSHPERVAAVHRAYAEAGADVLLTNTFQTIPKSLQKNGDFFAPAESVEAAYRLASATGKWVLGDLGPFDDQHPHEVQSEECIRRRVGVLQALSRCDAILVETLSDIRPLVMAVEAKPSGFNLLFLASATYLRDERGVRTFRGHPPEKFAREASPLVAAVGVNCGRDIGLDECVEIVRRYRQTTDLPIFVRPNAGTPERVDGNWVYPHSADEMANWLPELFEAGASMIGGCCGTTPDHIAAFREVVDSWNKKSGERMIARRPQFTPMRLRKRQQLPRRLLGC